MSPAFRPDAPGLGEILANLPEFIIVVDRAGLIRYLNRVEPGYVREEVVGMHGAAIVTPESRPAYNTALESVLGTGAVEKYEAQVALPDGSVGWYRTEMRPLREDDEIVAALLIATNITELKAAHQSLAQLRRLLPVCSWCDRIRSEDGTWERIEAYLQREASTDVTHSLCGECFQRQLEGLDDADGTSASVA